MVQPRVVGAARSADLQSGAGSGFRRNGLEPIFFRAGEQPIHEAVVVRHGLALEEILAGVKPLNVEFLPGGNAVASAERGRENHLTFG